MTAKHYFSILVITIILKTKHNHIADSNITTQTIVERVLSVKDLMYVESNQILVVIVHTQRHPYVAATDRTSMSLVMHHIASRSACVVVVNRIWSNMYTCTDTQYICGLHGQLKIMIILRTVRKFTDGWQPWPYSLLTIKSTSSL